ncbi:MAG: trigger factor [Actinomycetota bacterium]|nr:trigger factor [Actinomycetota bacterium]
MKTSVTELPDSRVRVDVDVTPDDVDRGISRAARGLARDMRLPGFRKGKAPPSLIIQRVGREAVLQQALRDSLPEWYERALLSSGVNPVGDPSIEVTSVPDEGEPLSFQFEVGVRPPAELGEYKGLEVGRPETDVPDDVLERELEQLRENFARLEDVERPAAKGDFVLVDFRGTVDGEPFDGGEAHDELVELGSGRLIEGFEEQLEGASAGEQREVKITFPDDYRAEQLAGKDASFESFVKEVREKVLPDLDDEFAVSAGGFDTLDELRDDIREKLRTAAEERTEAEFRLAAVDAAVDASKVDVPAEILTGRAAERWERVERQIAAQGLDPAAYLRMQGKTREEIIEESKPDAERELKREAVLSAIADVEGIDVTEEEMLEALAHTAEHERTTPEKLLERLRKAGRDSLVREDLRIRKTIDLLAESAKPIPLAQAEARERLWTPEKERQSEQEGAGLWTPGS